MRWPFRRADLRCDRASLREALFRTTSLDAVRADAEDEPPEGGAGRLRKRLTAWHLVGPGVGEVIGTGIFALTGFQARDDAAPAVVGSFVIAGVALLAALCYGEPASSAPPRAARTRTRTRTRPSAGAGLDDRLEPVPRVRARGPRPWPGRRSAPPGEGCIHGGGPGRRSRGRPTRCSSPMRGAMIFVLAVPALLVVVVGYAVGYALWDWLGGLVDDAIGTSLAPHAEVAGWIAGLLLLAVLVRLALVRRRRARARRRPRT